MGSPTPQPASIPDEENAVFMIGPWATAERSEKSRSWARRHIGEKGDDAVQSYYNGVRILSGSGFQASIVAVVSMMFPKEEFHLDQQKEFLPFHFTTDLRYFTEPEFQREIPIQMLEQRYANENAIWDAAACGNTEAALKACQQMARFTYGGRFFGSLYQTKIMLTVMNTLLRKAIERSNIHPYYIDEISSRYALMIENMVDEESWPLVQTMVKEYCAYVEVFMRDESRYVRISPDGLKYIRSTQKDALDVDKRAAMKRRIKGEQGRLTRVETTLCMCRAAGIQPAKEASIKLIDVLDPEQDAAQTFMNDFFYDKGLLFLSDEISATIKTSTTMGEEYTLGQSRLVGIVINRTGISFLYCTLDKLMRWVVSYEQRRVSAVMELLKSSSLAATDEDFATICNMSPKCIVIGKTCAIVPKIITGDKYGKAIDSTDIIKTHNATRLLTLTNLEQVYKYSYFVPTSSIGVELLTRTAALTRNELNEMISVWLDEMAESHTTVTTGRYVEAYINEQK